MGDLDLFYGKVKFGNFGFSEKKVKKLDFSETIAAFDLKLIDLMKICEYLRSRSFLELGPISFTYENLNLLFSETTGPFSKKF